MEIYWEEGKEENCGVEEEEFYAMRRRMEGRHTRVVDEVNKDIIVNGTLTSGAR